MGILFNRRSNYIGIIAAWQNVSRLAVRCAEKGIIAIKRIMGCSGPLASGLGSLAAEVAGATTLAHLLAILPVWMAGVGVGCAIGCGLFG